MKKFRCKTDTQAHTLSFYDEVKQDRIHLDIAVIITQFFFLKGAASSVDNVRLIFFRMCRFSYNVEHLNEISGFNWKNFINSRGGFARYLMGARPWNYITEL